MSLNVSALLLAIAMVESGNDHSAVGKKGEVSAYQITPKVWRLYTKVPPSRASRNPLTAHYVAKSHLQAIQRQLAGTPTVAESPYVVAAIWNGGPRAGTQANRSRKVNDYANRVSELYWFYLHDPRGIAALKANAPAL